jgi:hypothetical protein
MRFRHAEKEEEIEYARRLAIAMQACALPAVQPISGDALGLGLGFELGSR